jgi:hypothetical protein
VTDHEIKMKRLDHAVEAINHLAELQRLTTDPGERAHIAALGTILGELLRQASTGPTGAVAS